MTKLRPYLFLFVFFLCILSLPTELTKKVRTFMINCVIPSWHMSQKQVSSSHLPNALALENQLLRNDLNRLKKWVASDDETRGEIDGVYELLQQSENPFFERRGRYLAQILEKKLLALPAKVVFREPASWSSRIWINVGQNDNEALGYEVIAKNSPVVVGKAVVGVVETVTKKRSEVRLITDASLHISVRAVRGGDQNHLLSRQIADLIRDISLRDDLLGSEEMAHGLSVFRDQLNQNEEGHYLAKGVLQGASGSLWRVLGQDLKGIGFNYDYEDEEGPSRILTAGYVEGQGSLPLIEAGDLLVTTGLDGVFPPDLHVAQVTKILPLKEGQCSYQLKARSLAPNLNTLSEVWVLPPM